MPRLDREQAISVAVLVLLLLVCASVVGVLFQTRADAVQESSERREYSRASKPSCEQTQVGRPRRRRPPHSSMRRPRAWRARNCSPISHNWPAINVPALFRPAEKLPSAMTHLIRSGCRPRLI